VNELLFVRGVSRELFYSGLKELVRVAIIEKKRGRKKKYGKRELVNINAASPELLGIFPMMTAEIINNIILFRQNSDISNLTELIEAAGPEVAKGLKKYIDYKNNRFYTLDSTGWTQDHSTTQRILIMIKEELKTSKGYSITQWIDSVSDY